MRLGGHDGVPRPKHVDLDDVAELLAPATPVGGPHRDDAGVGHDDVQPAELTNPIVHRALQRRTVPHVGLRRVNVTAYRLDFLYRLVEVVKCGQWVRDGVDIGANIDGDDIHPTLGELD